MLQSKSRALIMHQTMESNVATSNMPNPMAYTSESYWLNIASTVLEIPENADALNEEADEEADEDNCY